MTDTLHNAPIVLDNGSGTIRAGFAGDDLPKCYFPSFVGRPKHLRVLAGALEGEVFIGQRAATELRGLLKIRYPLEHGIVTDWDDMEKIWAYVYDEGLKTLSEEVGLAMGPCVCPSGLWLTKRKASRPPNRTPPQPPIKPRHRRPDPLRDLQRARPLHLHPGRPLPLRVRSDNRRRPRLRRRRVPQRAGVPRLHSAEQHTADRRRRTGRDGAPTDVTAQERLRLPHQCRERGSTVDQRERHVRGSRPEKGGEGVGGGQDGRRTGGRVHASRREQTKGMLP